MRTEPLYHCFPAITGVRVAGEALQGLVSDQGPGRELFHRRCDQLQDALAHVKAGLNQSNHPHVLSHLRRNVRGKTEGNYL